MRWAAVLLIALPMLLLLAAAFAAITHSDLSRSLLRALRYLLLIEFSFLVLMAIVGFIYEAVSTARDQRLYPPPGKLIDIGGYRLHLYCTGEGGPTVILDYGLVGSYIEWHLVQAEIARFTRVCSYDRGGYGWSDPSRRARTPDVMAEELHTLLEKAGEKPPFILVGHSMGGFDVLMYRHRYPQQVAGLVLLDSAHPDEPIPFHWRNKAWLRFLEYTAPVGLPRWRGWCAQGPEEIRRQMLAFSCLPRIFRTNYRQWSAFDESAQQVRALGSLGNLPLLVVARDPERQPANQRVLAAEQHWFRLQQDLARLSSNSTLVVAQGSGHGVAQQRPDLVIEEIRKMIGELRASQMQSK